MMAPDYAHWHGMYEVAERFYMELIPQARELCEHAKEHGNAEGAEAALEVIQKILDRPEHAWFEADKRKRAEEREAARVEPMPEIPARLAAPPPEPAISKEIVTSEESRDTVADGERTDNQ